MENTKMQTELNDMLETSYRALTQIQEIRRTSGQTKFNTKDTN